MLINKLEKYHSKNLIFIYLKALINFNLADFHNAITLLENIENISDDTLHNDCYLLLVNCFIKISSYNPAIKIINLLIERGANFEIYLILAKLYEYLNLYEASENIYIKLMLNQNDIIKTEYIKFLLKYGCVLYKNGVVLKALESFKKAFILVFELAKISSDSIFELVAIVCFYCCIYGVKILKCECASIEMSNFENNYLLPLDIIKISFSFINKVIYLYPCQEIYLSALIIAVAYSIELYKNNEILDHFVIFKLFVNSLNGTSLDHKAWNLYGVYLINLQYFERLITSSDQLTYPQESIISVFKVSYNYNQNCHMSVFNISILYNFISDIQESENFLNLAMVIDPDQQIIWHYKCLMQQDNTDKLVQNCFIGAKIQFSKNFSLLLLNILFEKIIKNYNSPELVGKYKKFCLLCSDQLNRLILCCNDELRSKLLRFNVLMDIFNLGSIRKDYINELITKQNPNSLDSQIRLIYSSSDIAQDNNNQPDLIGYSLCLQNKFDAANNYFDFSRYPSDSLMYIATAYCLIICQYYTEKYSECLETLCILIETVGLNKKMLIILMILALKLPECQELVDQMISDFRVTDEDLSLFYISYKLFIKNILHQNINIMPYILRHNFKFGCSAKFCIIYGYAGVGPQILGSHCREVHYNYITDSYYYQRYINYYFYNFHLLIHNIHHQQLVRHLKKYIFLFGYDSYANKMAFLYELCCYNLRIEPFVNLLRDKVNNESFMNYLINSNKFSPIFSNFICFKDEDMNNHQNVIHKMLDEIFYNKNKTVNYLIILIQLINPKDGSFLKIFDKFIGNFEKNSCMKNYLYLMQFQTICNICSSDKILNLYFSVKNKVNGQDSKILLDCILLEKYLSMESLNECEQKLLSKIKKEFYSYKKLTRFYGKSLFEKCMIKLKQINRTLIDNV